MTRTQAEINEEASVQQERTTRPKDIYEQILDVLIQIRDKP